MPDSSLASAATAAAAAQVLAKLAKQRHDSMDSYKAGGRLDLVEKEAQELALMNGYLPQQMGR